MADSARAWLTQSIGIAGRAFDRLPQNCGLNTGHVGPPGIGLQVCVWLQAPLPDSAAMPINLLVAIGNIFVTSKPNVYLKTEAHSF